MLLPPSSLVVPPFRQEQRMIITNSKKQLKLEWERRQFWLPLLSFDLYALTDSISRKLLGDGHRPISINFCKIEALACILPLNERSDIFLHLLLNDDQTPPQVFQHIVTHEIIHLLVPPEKIGRRLVHHSPAFWDREKELIPDRVQSWSWIYSNFSSCLHRDEKKEQTVVKKGWKSFIGRGRYPWDLCLPRYEDRMF
jgi:hypothetical protein